MNDQQRADDDLKREVDWLEAFDGLHCPECGAILDEEHRTEKEGVKKQHQLDAQEAADASVAAKEAALAATDEANRLEKEIAAIVDPTPPQYRELDQVEEQIDVLRAQLNAWNLDGARAIVEANEQASGRDHQLVGQLRQLTDALERSHKDLRKAREQLDPESLDEWQRSQVSLEEARNRHYAAATKKGAVEMRANQLAEQLKRHKELLERLDHIRAELGDTEQEVAEWRFLERACGPKGLQALELSAAGPTVAATANQLLTAAYGDRFRVDFETQRQSADGKRMIEDFQIWVTDKERGRRKLLENVSGGEYQWLDRALMDAFAHVRAGGEQVRFETAFTDEGDNNLDSEQSKAFLDMIEAGHELLGRQHTVLITHNPDVQERVRTQIHMEDL